MSPTLQANSPLESKLTQLRVMWKQLRNVIKEVLFKEKNN